MVIRRAEAVDKPAIHRLLRQVNQLHSDGRPDLFKAGGQKYTDAELDGILADDSRPVFVARNAEGQCVGYAFCIYQQQPETMNMHPRKTLYIDDLCVDAAARRQGIGQELYAHVLAQAEANDCDSVTLNVWECNAPARRFYEQQGLVPLKTTMERQIQRRDSFYTHQG